IAKIVSLKFSEILNRTKQLNPTQREILDILSLANEPVEIETLNKFFNSDISAHLYQLQSFGFIKIENEKVLIAYKSLKKHIESNLNEEARKRFHLNYAIAYYDEKMKNADKVLYHFARMGDSEGVAKFAEPGIENLILKGEFKKAINLCQEIFELLPEYLKPLFKIKLGFIYLQLGNYKDAISTLEDLDELEAFELKSEAYFHLGETNKAVEILKHTYKTHDTIYERIRIATKISQILASIGDADTALILLKSFENGKILAFIEKTDVIGDLYAGLGITSQMKRHKERAKIYFELSLEHRLKKQNPFKLIAGYNNIANFYSINNKYDEAITYWKKALEILKSTGNIVQSAHIYNNIGINQFKRNNYEKALENYQRALAIYRTINDVHGIANVLGNIGELMIEEFKLGEAYKYIKEAKELHTKTNNLDGLLEANLLLLSLYLAAGDIKSAESTLDEINQGPSKVPAELIEYYRACIKMKKKNFTESESILMGLLNNGNIERNSDIYLKILIPLLKLNYMTGGIKKLEMVRSIAESYAEQVENFNLRALLFFFISLSYEDKNKPLAVKYLNKSIESLGYEFFEPKWKIYLMLAQNYKRRGIESKFLQSFETALINFQELLQRIEKPEFIKSYLADVENEKFLKILQKLKV
ncbi:MAG: tetratricopeptide repeat protein, partial [Candidatus Kryptonium sp.]